AADGWRVTASLTVECLAQRRVSVRTSARVAAMVPADRPARRPRSHGDAALAAVRGGARWVEAPCATGSPLRTLPFPPMRALRTSVGGRVAAGGEPTVRGMPEHRRARARPAGSAERLARAAAGLVRIAWPVQAA